MKNNNAQGILFILLGMFIFAIQDTLMKYIIASVALYEVYLIRTFVSLLVIVFYLKITDKPIITAVHLLIPTCSFKINLAKIVIKKGLQKNSALAVARGIIVNEI